MPVEFTPAEQHPAEQGDILGRAEQAATPTPCKRGRSVQADSGGTRAGELTGVFADCPT